MRPTRQKLIETACLAVLLAGQAFRCQGDLITNLPPVADTTLFEDAPDNNLGATATLIAGTTATGFRNRALVKFDLAGIPANATITSAALTLNVVKAGSGPGSTFDLHFMLQDWGEGSGTGNQGTPANTGEATWNNRFHPSTPWNSPGATADADYVATISATNFMDGAGSYTFVSTPGLVSDVQAWLNHPGNNFGWILISEDEMDLATARRIGSREDPNNTPVLTVQYTVPAPPVPPTIASAARVGDQFQFSFNAESNRSYTVQYIGALTGTNWGVLTNISPMLAPANVLVSDPLTTSNRFYRVRTP